MKLETFADLGQVPGIELIEDSTALEVLEELIERHPEVHGETLLRAAATLYQIPPHAKLAAVHKALKALPLGHLIRLWRHRNPGLRGPLAYAMTQALPLIAASLGSRIERSRPPEIPMPEGVLDMRLGVLRRRLARYWPEFYRELGVELSYAHDDISLRSWLQQRPPRGPTPAIRAALERLGTRLFERMGRRLEADDQRLLEQVRDEGVRALLEEQLDSPQPSEAMRASARWRIDLVRRAVIVESPQFDGCFSETCESVSCVFTNPKRPRFGCVYGPSVPCSLKRFAATRIAELVSDQDTTGADPDFVRGLKGLVRSDGAEILLSRLSAIGAGPTEAPDGAKVAWLFTPPDKLEAVWITEKKKGGLKSKRIPSKQVRAALKHPRHHATQTLLDVRYGPRSGYGRGERTEIGPALATLANDSSLYLGGGDLVPLKVVVVEPRLAPRLDKQAMKFEIALGPVRVEDTGLISGQWLIALREEDRCVYVGVVSDTLEEAFDLLRGLERVEVSAEAQPRLAEGLLALEGKVPLLPHGSWLGQKHELSHHWVLKLEMAGARGERRAHASLGVRIVPQLGVLSPCDGPETLPLKVEDPDGTQLGHVIRDFPRELTEAQELAQRLELELEPGQFAATIDQLDAALALVARAQELTREGALEVAWANKPIAVKKANDAGKLNLRIGVKRDWLDLQGGFKLDGAELPLKELLDALRHNKRFVEVDEQTLVELDEELKRSLMPLVSLAREQAGKVVASPLSAPLVDELERVGVAIDAPAEWLEVTQKLDEAVALEPTLPELRAELRPYQVEGYAWAMRLAHWAIGACLADDMGLGKTLQALAVVSARASEGPTLVIAPTSVVPNWVREARKFAPHLAVHRVLQGAQLDEALLAMGPGVVLVTSWDLLVRNEARLANAPNDDGEGARPWRTLVLDEAQAMKNPATKRAQVARGVARDFALVLTGTPVENRPLELWSLMSVVAPGLLGSAESFRDRFARPIEERRPDAARTLARIVRPFILRRTKGEVAKDLPNKTEIRVDVALTSEEQERYQRVRNSAIKAMNDDVGGPPGQKMIRMLAVLTRLRQLACHPRLVDNKAPHTSSKLERLIELAEELAGEGRKMLVFSQFTELLALVREAFDAAKLSYTYLDGSTPGLEREKAVNRFQRGEVDAFLLSLKAGGVGLNLTAATEVIHLDPWWNPAVEDQASDRAHRIGQDKPVTVYRMVALGTIEEQILTLHADKRMMMASLLEGTDNAAPISSDEMLALLMDSGDTVVSDAPQTPTPTLTLTPALPLTPTPTLTLTPALPLTPEPTLRPAPAPALPLTPAPTLPFTPAPPEPQPPLSLTPPPEPQPPLSLTPPPEPQPPLSLTPPPEPQPPHSLTPPPEPEATSTPAPPPSLAPTPNEAPSPALVPAPTPPSSPDELLARVSAALASVPAGLTKAELLTVTGVPDPLWPDFRRLLQARPEFEVTGSTRSTRYRLKQTV